MIKFPGKIKDVSCRDNRQEEARINKTSNFAYENSIDTASVLFLDSFPCWKQLLPDTKNELQRFQDPPMQQRVLFESFVSSKFKYPRIKKYANSKRHFEQAKVGVFFMVYPCWCLESVRTQIQLGAIASLHICSRSSLAKRKGLWTDSIAFWTRRQLTANFYFLQSFCFYCFGVLLLYRS